MMISIPMVLLIIAIHFFADFVCQSHDMAINKSKSNYWLTYHVLVYTLVTFLAWHFCILQPPMEFDVTNLALFVGLIFSTHWITDYISSRFTSKFFGKGDSHNGFVVVGLDQVAHYIQLFLAYYLFVK